MVVPTRNRAPLLDRLLRQLVGLDDGLRYEVVVVDEASDDTTPALLDAFRRRHGVTVVRHEQPRGLSAARNAGFRASSAPFVAWIDDDDLTSPDRLRRQHDAIANTDRGWSSAGRIDVDDTLAIVGHVRCPEPDDLLARLLRSNVLPAAGQGLLIDRALVEQVGPYDEALDSAEDWDYAIRLATVCDAHQLDEPLVGYRTGVASMSTDTARMQRAIAAVIEKHHELYRARGVEPDWGSVHQSLLRADLMRSHAAGRQRAWRAAAASRSWPSLRRAAVVSLAPEVFKRKSLANVRAQVPAEWVAQAQRWLSGVHPLPQAPDETKIHPEFRDGSPTDDVT